MAHLSAIGVHRVTADDTVKRQTTSSNAGTFECLYLPGRVVLYFDGRDSESEANLLGFLDQMHSIRNALMDDISNRTEAAQ